MTGAVQAAASGLESGISYTVTRGFNAPISGYSFSGPALGNMNASAFKSALITRLLSQGNSPTTSFILEFSAQGFPQNYLSGILVQDSAGNWRRFSTYSGCTYVSAVNITQYSWSTTTNPVWTNAGTSQVRIIY